MSDPMEHLKILAPASSMSRLTQLRYPTKPRHRIPHKAFGHSKGSNALLGQNNQHHKTLKTSLYLSILSLGVLCLLHMSEDIMTSNFCLDQSSACESRGRVLRQNCKACDHWVVREQEPSTAVSEAESWRRGRLPRHLSKQSHQSSKTLSCLQAPKLNRSNPWEVQWISANLLKQKLHQRKSPFSRPHRANQSPHLLISF